MMETIATMAASFCLLAVVLGPLERLFPARPGQRVLRAELAVDACFFAGQYLVFAALTLWLLSGVARWVDSHSIAALRSFGRSLPLWLHAALAVMLGDLLVYWFHRACHHYEFLWRFHAVHHSAEQLDWLAAHREHPLDGIATQLLLNLPGIALGLPFEAIGAVVVIRGFWAVFIHSNVRLPVGPLRYVLGAPEVHHWHHLRTARTAHNFANLAPYLDVLFGTYHCPEGPETFPLGNPEPGPRGYLAQLVHPFLPGGIAAKVWPIAPARANGDAV
jgi:sterol desaturase/sphingolipid hydroxylase (fatty acid hydroxylase superfamily)